jgi:hypothetical protein
VYIAYNLWYLIHVAPHLFCLKPVCIRCRGLASAAVTYLLGDDEDLEPDNSRTALILGPGSNPSVLDVAVVAAQRVSGSAGSPAGFSVTDAAALLSRLFCLGCCSFTLLHPAHVCTCCLLK